MRIGTGWRREIACLISTGSFRQNIPVIRGFFARGNLQIKASYPFLPPCLHMKYDMYIVYICSIQSLVYIYIYIYANIYMYTRILVLTYVPYMYILMYIYK